MTLEDIDQALRSEIESRLNSEEIWAFGSFGWVSAEDVDPDFVGHAIWQTEPPIDIAPLIFERKPREKPVPRPEEWRQVLAISGSDFEGLMKAARMSIGLYLVQSQLNRETQFPSDDFLDLHWTGSIIYLATASERLREFLIAAAFRETQKQYVARGGAYRGQNRAWYSTAFLEAQEQFSATPSFDSLAKLLPMAQRIQVLRDRRNMLIHELATAIGRQSRHLIEEPNRPARDASVDFGQIKEAVETARLQRERQQISATAELRDWYDLLVRAINEAFIFEYHRRREA